MRIPHGLRCALASQAAAPATDQNFSDVSLLLYGDGTNGSTAIVDSSSNGHAITVNGDAQISTAQSKFGGSSLYFDGTGDYLSIPYDSTFDFSGDFTVEFWVRRAGDSTGGAGTTYEGLIGSNASGVPRWTVYLNRSTKNIVWFGNDGSLRETSGTTISDDTWYHIAWSRNGTTLKGFINGTQVYSATTSTSYTTSTSGLRVGHDLGANRQFYGYIDDLRITKGVARYTANFTPPTASFSTVTPGEKYFYNTSLLLHGDGTNGSTDFVDSTNNFVNYANSDASATNGEGPNGGTPYWVDILPASANFHYSNNSRGLNVLHNGLLDTSNMLYLTGSQYGNGNVTQARFDLRNYSAVTSVRIYAEQPYIAAQYHPYEARLLDSNKNVISNTTLVINNSTPQWLTVPVAGSPAFLELYAPTNPGARLYIFGLEVNGQEVISKPITAYGDAQISTAQSKFGGASMYFDGTGDYITVPSDTSFDFGTGDFTIEFWMNPSNITGTWQAIISRKYQGSGGWRIYKTAGSNNLSFYHPSGYYSTTNTGLTNGTWHHIAVVRSGSTLTTYVDGTSRGTDTISAAVSPTSADVEIGQGVYTSAYPYEGYLDDIRITKGVARYTANFTPPTSAFPDS